MKYTPHLGSFKVIAACLAFALLSHPASAASSQGLLEFENAPISIKRSIISGISKSPANATFVITRGIRSMRPILLEANSRLPRFLEFGLKAVPVRASPYIPDHVPSNNFVYVYRSQKEFDELSKERILFSGIRLDYDDCYVGSTMFYDGNERFLLVYSMSHPIKERFSPIPVMSNGTNVVSMAFEDAVKNIDLMPENPFLNKQVFMLCNIGAFGLKIDFWQNAANQNNRTAQSDEMLVFLGRGEISEIVYWLWRRKGRSAEYEDFVRDHPELFEPIGDVGDFKTELGRALLEVERQEASK